MTDANEKQITPGVYLTEINAFPNSVVGVQTAIPAFIGYTEKATQGGKTEFFKPIAISSIADFESIFGGDFKPVYNIVQVSPESFVTDAGTMSWGFQVGSSYYKLEQIKRAFYLHRSMWLFFANGGGKCFVVSVGDYTGGEQQLGGVAVQVSNLLKGIVAIHDQGAPTMLVVPDASLLPDQASFGQTAQAMLAQCGELQDRMAILDVYDALSVNQSNISTALEPVISAFQEGVGGDNLGYGTAYFPFLNTTVVQPEDVNYTNFNSAQSASGSSGATTMLQFLLGQAADSTYGVGSAERNAVQKYIDGATTIIDNPAMPDDPAEEQQIHVLNENLKNSLPVYKQWLNLILQKSECAATERRNGRRIHTVRPD
jgi:uncharacterized protein